MSYQDYLNKLLADARAKNGKQHVDWPPSVPFCGAFIHWTCYDEVHDATPQYMEKAMRTIIVPRGYRYAPPVSCVAGPYLRGESKGAKWTRLWPRVDRRVDSRCASSELRDLERTDWLPCTGGPSVQQPAVLRANASGAGDAQEKLQEER